MELQITTLIENQSDDNGTLRFEHGLSIYVEADGKKILFDTGQSGAFIENAKALGINLNTLDYCILSHGHYDHTGGVERFVSEVENLPEFIMGEEFFQPKYKINQTNDYQYNGNSFSEALFSRKSIKHMIVKKDMVSLTKHLVVFHHFRSYYEMEGRNPKFVLLSEEGYHLDSFQDEIALGILTKNGLVVVVGCSHAGIMNILHTISERMDMPIHTVIGGTHLVEAKEDRIKQTIAFFQKMKIQQIAVSHCTGEVGIRMMQEAMGKQFVLNNTGHIIRI